MKQGKVLSSRQKEDLAMYFDFAKRAASRSTSSRLKVGACIVTKNGGNYVGYNGTLSNRDNSCEVDNETHDGVKAACKIMKSRYGKAFETCKLNIRFDKGLEPYSGLFDYWERLGLMPLRGQFFNAHREETMEDALSER